MRGMGSGVVVDGGWRWKMMRSESSEGFFDLEEDLRVVVKRRRRRIWVCLWKGLAMVRF